MLLYRLSFLGQGHRAYPNNDLIKPRAHNEFRQSLFILNFFISFRNMKNCPGNFLHLNFHRKLKTFIMLFFVNHVEIVIKSLPHQNNLRLGMPYSVFFLNQAGELVRKIINLSSEFSIFSFNQFGKQIICINNRDLREFLQFSTNNW